MKKTKSVKTLGVLFIILASWIFISTAEARVMNIEKEGSLTIHKYLNPDVTSIENGGSGFQGDGSLSNSLMPEGILEFGSNGETSPLPGVEFSVYGRLSDKDLEQILGKNSDYDFNNPTPLDQVKVNKFIKGREPDFQGITDEEGIVTFENIPIHTVDLTNNHYLVVESKTPGLSESGQPIVQLPSRPVLINIPVTNPKVDTKDEEVNHYLFDVQLYMKNYQQDEPGLEKTIDKPSHSKGEEVKYALTIQPLPFDINEYQELEVKDELDKSLNFLKLGHDGGSTTTAGENILEEPVLPEDSVQFYNGTTQETIVLLPDQDYTVTTPLTGQNGTIQWVFTEMGIQKLTGIQENDGSFIRLFFTALTNEKVQGNQIVPNDSTLEFVNKWGYGTKPKDPETDIPVSPKPSEAVNTIFGDASFVKVDYANPETKLKGAEFLVRNRSLTPITAYNNPIGDPNRKIVTYPAGTELYAVIVNNEVVGWTPDWQRAMEEEWLLTSDEDGLFYVSGLPYSREVIYRKMYIFSVVGVKDIQGTEMQYIDHYEYVLSNKRRSNIAPTEEEIQKEIQSYLDEHPGSENGEGAWLFYKESEVDTARFNLTTEQGIDYLGEVHHQYELIEVKPPDSYIPLEDGRKMNRLLRQQIDFGQITSNGFFEPSASLEDYFHNPLRFSVPGGTEDGDQGVVGNIGDAINSVEIVPNKKLPELPATGNWGTFILLSISALLVLVGILLRFKKKNEVQ